MGEIKERLLDTSDAGEMLGKDGISTVNGVAEFYSADRPAWWDIKGAYVVQGARTMEEVVKLAHMDWKVAKAKLFTAWAAGGDVAKAKHIEVPGFKAVVRMDTKAHLGIVSDSYELIQNQYLFDFTEALLEQGAKYESAGVLGAGENVFTLARIPNADFSIGDDQHKQFLCFTASHDGTGAVLGFGTDWRVVCRNTKRFALADLKADEKAGKGIGFIKILHRKNAQTKLELAKSLVAGAVVNSGKLAEKFRALVAKQVQREHVETILDRLFPKPAEGISPVRREKVLEQILANFEANDGNVFPEQRGTAYAMFNAITNYVDHGSSVRVTSKRAGQTPDSIRAERSLFGEGAWFKDQVLAVVEDVVLRGVDGRDVVESRVRFETAPVGGGLDDIIDNTPEVLN